MANKIIIPGWKYYNHAAIPTLAPHEEPDLKPVKDGSIWSIQGQKPLLIRYTTDWNCGFNTGWWYLIRETPFDISSLSSNSRKHIKEAYRKTRVERIDPKQHIDELYECYHQAYSKYEKTDNEFSYEVFKRNYTHSRLEYWAGFALDSGKLIGYMIVASHSNWAEIHVSKFHPAYLKLRVSDALYAYVLDFYLNKQKKDYVSSGARSISHLTNTQEYKEQHFGFRKCFCRLHIFYRPTLKRMFNLLFLFRGLFDLLGKHSTLIHHISAILKMESIVRNTPTGPTENKKDDEI